ncbi:MAG: hypothetical protein LBI72_04790 [Flavobacteriaceae bacterium]|jgi:hypothetical protein|nr:hypothetical protein [Flavobacteriaceae bacterium]
MKKSVQIAMLLGVFTLTLISCEKDDKQFETSKEVKTNIEANGTDNNDWGHTPIKPPKPTKRDGTITDAQENNDWGNTPIKPPKPTKRDGATTDDQENNDWGNTPITPPKRPKMITDEQENNDWGHTPITPPKK